MHKDIIGKYFKQVDEEKNGVYIACHVTGFDGEHYLTEYYCLSLGTAIKDSNLPLRHDFYQSSGFIEITKKEFELIQYLYKTSGKYEYNN